MGNGKPSTKKQNKQLLRRTDRQFAEILIEELERQKEDKYKKLSRK